MGNTYWPLTDSARRTWAANVKAKTTATPLLYGLTPEQAADFAAAFDDFDAKLTLATNPATRTSVAIRNKVDSRFVLRQQAKIINAIVQACPTVTNGQRQELGLVVRDVEPTPVPVAAYAPLAKVDLVGPDFVRVSLENNDPGAESKRRRPFGMKGAVVMTYCGPTPPTSDADWRMEGLTNKYTVDVQFGDTIAPGTLVWITAAWVNTRMEIGPAMYPAISLRLGGKYQEQAA